MRWSRIVGAAGVVLSLLGAACVESAPSHSPSWTGAVDVPPLARDSARRRAFEFTVRIRNLSCDGVGIGSGFLFDRTTLVTNRHVIAGAQRLSVSTWDGRTLEVVANESATIADLAIVRLSAPASPVAPLAGADPAPGSKILAVGYPRAGRIQAAPGRVVDFVDGAGLGNTGKVMHIDAAVAPGNSGGPVVDTVGNVVGVVYAENLQNDLGLAIPLSTLRTVIDAGELAPVPTNC